MEINRQYCPNAACVDVGKISHGNVKVSSHKEHRYYCATCGQRFRPSRDTLFYKQDVIGNKVFGSSPQTTLTIADAQIVTTGGDFHEPI